MSYEYSKQTWADGRAGGTPVTASRLNHMEDGIEAVAVAVDEAASLAGSKASLVSGVVPDAELPTRLHADQLETQTVLTVSEAIADGTIEVSDFSGAYADLTGKPALFSGAYPDLTGKPSIPALLVDNVPVSTLNIGSAPLTAADVGFYALDLVAPPAALLAASSAAAWPTANNAIFMRFSLHFPKNYRYINFGIGTASGNIQAGVVKLSGAKHVLFSKVMDSGVVPATAGNVVLDCGNTQLVAGEYALFLWADNTTVTARILNNSNLNSSRLVCERGWVGGVPAEGSLQFWDGARAISAMTLETDL